MIAPHAHDWHQLIYASEGVMWVHTAQGEWVVPPNRAVWVPAGVEHAIEMGGTVFVQTLYLATGVVVSMPERCCAVNVSPLLRELVIHTIRLGTLDRNVPERARLIGFLLDQLVRVTLNSPATSTTVGRTREACGDLDASASRRFGLAQTDGEKSVDERAYPGATVPKRNGHDFRKVAAATSAPSRTTASGRRPTDHGRRVSSRLPERQRLHCRVQAFLWHHAGTVL